MTQHILVVEDDGSVGRLVRRILEGAGFRVTVAQDFLTALPIIESSEPIDLLLADINLTAGTPHGISIGMMSMNKRPDLKIVYMTGAHDPKTMALYSDNAPVIGKPFTSNELVKAIKSALGDSS